MNHIYKVIWNTITQTWVAVSELSRAKGKTKSSKTLSAVVLAAVSAGAIIGDAEAAIFAGQGDGISIQSQERDEKVAKAEGVTAIAIGYDVSSKGTSALAIGTQTHATGEKTVAIGHLSTATGSESAAFGVNATAKGNGDIALGKHAVAEGGKDGKTGSAALGDEAHATGAQSAAVGGKSSASGTHTIASGYKANASGENAAAFGADSTASGTNSASIGPSSTASGSNSAALGMQAEAKGAGALAAGAAAQATQNGSTAVGAWTKATAEKTTALGDSAHATTNRATALGHDSQATGEFSTATGVSSRASGSASVATGKNAKASGASTIAIGDTANATGTDSIATGREAATTGSSAIATGAESSAANNASAYGNKAKATGGWSSAFGNESKAGAADASAFGNTATAAAQDSTAIGAHSSVTSVATGGTALGRSSSVTTAGGVALGQGSTSTRAALDGKNITISSQGNVVSSNHITDDDSRNNNSNDVYAPVKLINDPKTLTRVKETIKGTAGAVSLGNATTTRQLTNLAPGSADSDAVNVAQLKAVVGTIKHYNVTSKDGDITVSPDTTDPNNTVWDLKINPKYKIKYFSVKSAGGTNENNDGATGADAIAIGKDTTALRANAIAIGHEAKAQGYQNDIAIGYKAATNSEKSVAIGDNAKTDAGYSIALGTNATATVKNGIALGSESKASINNGQTGFDASQDADGARVNKYTNLTDNNQNVRTSTLAGLSIGDAAKTRQINHLAAGKADDDAVNVAQLKSVNLAFKGNSGSGDVRLHDQRLSVVGAADSFITTTASDKKLEITTTQGTFSTTDGKSSSSKQGLATTTAVASAINESGWEVQAKGTKVGLVNPGDKVNFTNADKSIEIDYSAEASGLSTIKFKAVTETIQTEEKSPITQIDVNGSTVSKTTKGENKPTGRFVVPTGDKTNKYALATAYDVADKVNQTGWNLYTNGGARSLINPGDYVNFKSGNATNATVVTEASEGATISYDVNVDNTTIKIDSNGNKLTANTGDVDSVTNTKGNSKKGQVTIHKDPLEPSKTDSGKLATVDTVVKAVNNAKWFAKASNTTDEVTDTNKTDDADNADGQAMSAGDKLTLKAGKNLRVKRDGADFTFALNNVVDLTDKGSLTIGGTTVTDGGVTIKAKEAGKTNVTLTANGLDNGGNKIVNVAEGTKDTDAVNVKQLNDSISTESVAKAADAAGDKNIASVTVDGNKAEGDKGAKYLVSVSEKAVKKAAHDAIDVKGTNFISATSKVEGDVETHTVTATTNAVTMNAAEGKANTPTATGLTTNKDVADAINASGWKISGKDTAASLVNPGNEVSFEGGEGTTVTVSNADGNGKRTVTIASTVKPNEKGVIEEVTENGTGTNPAKKGQVKAKSGDDSKVTTVGNVANMINSAKWFAKASNTTDEVTDTNKTDDADNADGQAMSAGDKLTLKAGKNLRVKRDGADFTFALNNVVDLTDKGSLTIGGTTVTDGGVTIKAKEAGKTNVTLTANGLDNGGNKIVNVAEGTKDTDAVNVAQLKSTERHITPTTYTYNETDKSVTLTYTDGNGNLVKDTNAKIDLSGLASKIKDYSFKTNATGLNLVGTGTETTVASGKSVNFAASDNLTLKQDVKDGNVTYTYGLKNQVVVGEKGTPGADGKPGKDGVDGSIGVNGKDGSAVAINGKDGSIGLNGENGKNGLTIKGDKGAVGVDGTNGKDGKDGMTRIVYTDNNQVKHEVATLDDGVKYAGDDAQPGEGQTEHQKDKVIAKKLNNIIDIIGGADKDKLSDKNIGVNNVGGKLKVQLAKELKGLTSAEFKDGDSSAVTNITNSGITIKPANSNDDSKTVSLTDSGLNNGGNTITNVAEGKNDTDAVNVKQLKDFKSEVAKGGLTFAGNSGTPHNAKLNSTVNIKGGEGNTDADQFDNGKNVMTTVNGDTVTVSIKKTPEVEGINITDTTGNVKVKLTQTDEGLKVSDGNNNATRITNVKAGEKDTDAVNVKQLKAAKTEVEAGENIEITSRTDATNGQTIYKVSAKGINDTSAAVKGGSDHVKVTKAANTHKDGSTTVTDYTVDLSNKTKEDIKKGVDAHTEVTTKGLTFNADKGTTGVKKLGSKVSVNGDGKNITTTADENGVKVSMKDDIKVNSVTAKEVKVGNVNINENGINAGGKRITNVAPGKDGTDAVNVNQLKYVAGNISNQINNVDKGLRAGIAGALASGGLYHATTSGKSMVSVGAGTYRGQNALAVGYSRLSDNGKVGVKFTVNSNSQGHAGASASVGYQW